MLRMLTNIVNVRPHKSPGPPTSPLQFFATSSRHRFYVLELEETNDQEHNKTKDVPGCPSGTSVCSHSRYRPRSGPDFP